MSDARRGAGLRWMYRSGRPNRIAAAMNRMSAVAGSTGLFGRRLVTLEVRGRRSGRHISFPLVVVHEGGERYLVSMLGRRVNWVSNVEADGGRAVLRHGRREPVRLEPVDPADRAPILRRYLALAPGARPHIPVDRRADLAEFARIADRYPVFRVCPDPSPAQR
jgi:deazaflavin-dependent oxidoreductase (nitroreductase family)